MQNRFTVKDFFYMLFAGVICLLLFLNMVKTQREADQLTRLNDTLGSQQATLSTLGNAIGSMQRAPVLDEQAFSRLLQAMPKVSGDGSSQPTSPSPTGEQSSSLPPPFPDDPYNLVKRPSFKPRYDNGNPVWTSGVNRRGLGQQWQAAPDADLPEDFAAGDTLVMSRSSDPKTLTPLLTNADAESTRLWWLTFDYLVNWDLDSPYHETPGLAKSWEVSEDGMVITFQMHEHAVWQDGQPVTADDVIFTWDLAMNPKIDSARIKSYITENVAKWERLDAHTVRFTMKQPYFGAVGICGNLFPIIPKHVYGDFSEDAYNSEISDLVVGCGPFKLESWDKKKQIVLVRNENYWGPKPALERIIIRIISNELTNLQEFYAGNVDYMTPVPLQWVENVDSERFKERNGNAVGWYSPYSGYFYLGYNMRKPCFADKRTRQALTMLIDRRGIIDSVFGGSGTEITGPFSVVAEQYDKSIQPWPFDPERAKALLAEVGWADTNDDGVIDMDLDGDGTREPFEVTYLVPQGLTMYERMQRIIKDSFKVAGINVNLDGLEWSVFIERLNQSQFDMVSLLWTTSPEGDPYQIWHSSQAENRGSNRGAYNNPEVDRLIEEGRRTLDKDARIKIWHEVHRLIHEDQPYTFLVAQPTRAFLDPRFKNVQKRDYRLHQPEWYVPQEAQKH